MLQLSENEPLCNHLSKTKKLVLVLATFLSVTETSKEDNIALQKVLCVYYPIRFKKKEVQALINLGSEVNTMTPAYTAKLGLKVQKTNIGAQKIDSSTLDTFKIVLADFQVENKLSRSLFF